MFNIIIFFVFQNIFILGVVFWLISFVGSFSYKTKTYRSSHELFECGFLNLSKFNLHFNFNFIVTSWLLIIYDIEFFFVVPYILNWSYLNVYQIFIFIFFCFLIYLAFIYEYQTISLNYYV